MVHLRLIHVQCDLRPHCGPCARAHLRCPGLRDPQQLVFRDQTQQVTQKVKAGQALKTIPNSIQPSIHEQAGALFFSRYVFGQSKMFEYLPEITSSADAGKHLAESIAAVSLAYFASHVHSSRVLAQARQRYICGLQSINSAIQDPHLATKDSTLLSIVLLAFYEKLTNTPRSAESWMKHMMGATALIKLRGQDQFQSGIGLRMSGQLIATIIVGCIQYNLPVPPSILQLREDAAGYSEKEATRFKFMDAMIRYAELLVDIKARNLIHTEIISTAANIDSDFRQLLDNTPRTPQNNTILVSALPNDVSQRRFHLYSDHKTTHMRNNMRIFRILLNEIIWKHYSEELVKSTMSHSFAMAKMKEAEDVIIILSTEICAVVSQYVRLPEHVDPEDSVGCSKIPPVPPATRGGKGDNFTVSEASQCHSLIWPMYVVGQSSFCPIPFRKWIISNLHFIADWARIKEAKIAAGYLEREEKIVPWSLYGQTGRGPIW
jgi:hypothetical protein